MSTIHLTQATTLTPEQYVAGLTDFGPGRNKIFSNSADDYLKVHHVAATEADVTEGSGGVWERLHYDWSNPERVVLTTTESNVWGGASGYTYTFAYDTDILKYNCGVRSLPAFIVADKEGVVRYAEVGWRSNTTERDLEKAIREALAK